jgi:Tfp pilus assembly protein PilF
MRRLLVPTGPALIALASVFAATPALAQYGAPPPAPARPVIVPQPDTPATAAPAATGPCQAGISKGARKAIIELQTAVSAKDAANIPARIAAAQAVAKSNDDRCFIAQMQVLAAVQAGNLNAVPAALEAQLATGSVTPSRVASLYESLAKLYYDKANYEGAGTSFERALALEPGRTQSVIMLAETRYKQNRVADALPLYRKAIALEIAAGRKPDQNWYKRAVAVAQGANSPLTPALALEWVSAYPSPANWRDAIRLYSVSSGLPDSTLVDLYRLQRLTHSLSGESDHARYAQALLAKGFPGEAKAMLDEGFAANAVDRNRASMKSLSALATTNAAGDRASLEGQAKAALASPAAKQAMVLGEAYYGYGDYAKAAAMIRAAQGKSGVDAELANLRLGMALAASGDKAGATAALALVTGPRAEIARYWQAYVNSRP